MSTWRRGEPKPQDKYSYAEFYAYAEAMYKGTDYRDNAPKSPEEICAEHREKHMTCSKECEFYQDYVAEYCAIDWSKRDGK